MIPRRMHLFWLGEAAARPEHAIGTWRRYHPDIEFRLWGMAELQARVWRTSAHMSSFMTRDIDAVRDLMRWEVLLDEGGIAVDCESICLQALPEWLFDCEMFAAWENELARPGLLATGTLGTLPANPFIAQIIADINAETILTDRMAWQATGPQRLTDAWHRHRYANLTVLPSHFFMPRHYSGVVYSGSGPIFADKGWDSTLALIRPSG